MIRQSVLLLALTVALASPGAVRADDPDQTFRFSGPEGEQIEGGVWLPAGADAGPRPLIVISHGNGGWYLGHHDTAEALAGAGFVVASLTHPGDNYRDESQAILLTRRAPQLSALIDYMTDEWRGPVGIDPERIGAFGFSAGGFTVTSAVGGVSNPQAIQDHCAAHPGFFACRMLARHGVDFLEWRPNARDVRIKAAVIAAPALGMAFTTESLAGVTLPVQLWQAGEDEILPAPHNVEPIRDRLGRAPEYHRVENAMHFDFLTPCASQTPSDLAHLCASSPGFDRAAFKEVFNREVVRFFRDALAANGGD